MTLVNCLPHFVLGIWGGRMLSGLGFGNRGNIIYGIFNFIVSIGLYVYQYGLANIFQNGIYLGALFVIISYFIVGKTCYNYFHKNYYDSQGDEDK